MSTQPPSDASPLVLSDDSRLYDSDWLPVQIASAVTLDPVSPGGLLIRRVGALVTLRFDSLKLASDATDRVDLCASVDSPLPYGFRPASFHIQGRVTKATAITVVYNVTAWSGRLLSVYSRTNIASGEANQASGWSAADALVGEMIWLTDEPIPA